MNARIGILICLAVFLGACGRGRNALPGRSAGPVWYASLEEARKAAGENGDIILMSFEAPWCPWSKMMHDSVYVNPTVAESLSAVKCVALEAGSDTALEKELGIVVYPTIVVADAYGGELGRMIGYYSPPEFLERLGTVRHSRENLAEMFRREEAGSEDPEFLMAFGRMLLEMGLYDGALLRFDRATRVDQDSVSGWIEEAEYSMAECYMLSGKYKEAGRRFRVFTERFPDSERCEYAEVLAAVCYRKAGYPKVASEIYEEYLREFGHGDFAPFVRAVLDSLNGDNQDAS
jgi:tetratricopeptide (TPR) repeat protein